MSLRVKLAGWAAAAALWPAGNGWAQAVPPAELRAVAGRPEVWPKDVAIKTPVASAVKNAAPIPAGTAMKVVGLEGPLINLDYQGGLYIVPIAQTDFLERAGVNLMYQSSAPPPAPPRVPPPAPAPAAAPVQPASTAPGARTTSVLGVTLAPALLVFDPAAKVDRLIPGGRDVAGRSYLLLQFGGGKRWGKAMQELGAAVQAARDRGADFETVLVPLQASSVQSAIGIYRESGFSGPMVDPRKTEAVASLWSLYGHEGTFALALVDAKGTVVRKTVPSNRSVDQFHPVLEALSQLPTR